MNLIASMAAVVLIGVQLFCLEMVVMNRDKIKRKRNV